MSQGGTENSDEHTDEEEKENGTMCELNTLELKIAELKEWQALLEEATATVESIKDFIKAELDERNVEELTVGTHICRFTTVTSNRIDTGALKKALPEIAAQFTKPSTSRRFTVS